MSPSSIFLLDESNTNFPDPRHALTNPNGLLAMGGDLSPERLLKAYRRGIFPWFDDAEPYLWWSPDPRCVLFPHKFKLSRSLKKNLRNQGFQHRINTDFESVIEACSVSRSTSTGTWITQDMMEAYLNLFKLGHAHSYETWQNNTLVGGLYGVKIGSIFCGESMFSRVRDSSKAALYQLCQQQEITLIDCQVPNDHLLSLGAETIPREAFLELLSKQG